MMTLFHAFRLEGLYQQQRAEKPMGRFMQHFPRINKDM
jgi:hypothetical protein